MTCGIKMIMWNEHTPERMLGNKMVVEWAYTWKNVREWNGSLILLDIPAYKGWGIKHRSNRPGIVKDSMEIKSYVFWSMGVIPVDRNTSVK